jgi:cellulose synthase/poly-beta-1,6-N-acetylglucosamine synthase-like glycosyltransferase
MSALDNLDGQKEPERPEGLGLYWRYEKAVRRAESRFGSTVVYTGAVSAVRRSLFTPLPEDTLVDDLVTPLRVIQQGYRVVFEPEARAIDWISTVPGHEFARKVRTLAGLMQTLVNLHRLVGPLNLWAWWQFISHKVLRLVVPYALLCTLLSSALLEGTFYQVALLIQILIYGLGLLGCLSQEQSKKWKRLVATPRTFLMLNLAAVAGMLQYLAGQRLSLWQPVSFQHPHRS